MSLNARVDMSTSPELTQLSGKQILVAEDNAINMQVLVAMLSATHANIKTTTNGQELLDAYNDCKPDIVLTDIQMPVLDGVEACLAIREQDKHIPIIAVTANIMETDRKRYFDSGFNDCIAKPIMFNTLCDVLKKTLNA